MENENINTTENDAAPAEKGNYFLKITVTEAIIVLTVLIFFLSAKFFWRGGYSAIAEWYGKNMTGDTSAEEILDAFADGGTDEV